LWAFVHDGTVPFPGVLDCMEWLIGAGKRLVLLSNRRADPMTSCAASPGSACRALYHGVIRRAKRLAASQASQRAVLAALGRRCLQSVGTRPRNARRPISLLSPRRPKPISSEHRPGRVEDTIEGYAPCERRAGRRLPMVCCQPDSS